MTEKPKRRGGVWGKPTWEPHLPEVYYGSYYRITPKDVLNGLQNLGDEWLERYADGEISHEEAYRIGREHVESQVLFGRRLRPNVRRGGGGG